MRTINDIKNWDDYWKIFEKLCASLTNRGKTEIAEEFKEAQKYVNGLTDGWFDFLDKFKTVYKDNLIDLEIDDRKKIELLINALSAGLKGR